MTIYSLNDFVCSMRPYREVYITLYVTFEDGVKAATSTHALVDRPLLRDPQQSVDHS